MPLKRKVILAPMNPIRLRTHSRVLMIVSILTICQASLCFAAGYEGPGVGTREVTMGGAHIGLADDWTAIYWNPAGLTQLEGWGGGLELAHPVFELAYPSVDGHDPDGSTQVTEAKIKPKVFLPNLGYCHRLRDWTLAGGIYTQVGVVIDWSGTVDGDDVCGLNELEIIAGNLSVARMLIPDLSLGLGLNILYGRNKYEQDKETTNLFIPINTNSEAAADGFGYEGVLGILYKAHPRLSIGGVYRSGTDIKLEGKATVCQSIIRRARIDNSSDYTGALPYPTTYGIGLAFRPVDRLILTADWTRTDWTRMKKEIEYDDPGGTLENKNDDLGWEAVDRYRFGAEYSLTDNWDLRAGLYTDPSPLSDEGESLGPLTEMDKIAYTFGMSYKRKNLHLDLGYILVDSDDKEAEGKSYIEKINFYRITLSYSLDSGS